MTISARQISSKMAKLMVNQANRELDASRMYLSMDLWFRFHDYDGSAAWCQSHSEEERSHAMKIFDHLALRKTENHCVVSKDLLSDFSMDDMSEDKISMVWEKALKQEVQNTQCYYEMAELADEEKDYVSKEFLGWFLHEQLMEENAVSDLYEKALKLEKTGGLYAAMDGTIPKMDH